VSIYFEKANIWFPPDLVARRSIGPCKPGCNIKINEWFGRLGNNIIQVSTAIDMALFYKCTISFPNSPNYKGLFNFDIISDYFNKTVTYKKNEIITDDMNFFGPLLEDVVVSEENYKIKADLLKESFTIKDINKLDEDDVAIHIRSGDIFQSPSPVEFYAPPPVAYYAKQLNQNQYKKIIIVCEDNVNPAVNKLLELYPNATWNKNNLEEDIRLILGATNVISSVGTFVTALLMLSDNIKSHYGKDCNNEELEEYYKVAKPWLNSDTQRDYILSYKY